MNDFDLDEESTESLDGLVSRLCFEIGGTLFGLVTEQVVEIVDFTAVVRLPRAPSHVLGLVNFRGRPVPLVSFARFVGMTDVDRTAPSAADQPHRMLIVSAANMTVALRVDRVRSIAKIPPPTQTSHLKLPPQLEPYSLGQADVDGEILVDFALGAFLESSRVRA